MKILLIEPFYTGSHKQWADGWKKHSNHQIKIWTLPGRHWKWRMHGAAVSFAQRMKNEKPTPDLIVCSDFLDVATYRGLAGTDTPILMYFHENQFAYPWSNTDPDKTNTRDRRYMWINYTSALAADRIWFNSAYNKASLLNALPPFMSAFPDDNAVDVEAISEKSMVMPLGLEIREILDLHKKNERKADPPIVVWNHRWEYDKNPDLFFTTLMALDKEGLDFRLMVLGTKTNKFPPIFDQARKALHNKIIQFGELESKEAYLEAVVRSDILPVTNYQDFFGISVVEGIAAGVVPLLPRGLAYEEHVDHERYPNLYYKTQDEFTAKLRTLMLTLPSLSLAEKMMKYDWEHIVKTYDREASSIINEIA